MRLKTFPRMGSSVIALGIIFSHSATASSADIPLPVASALEKLQQVSNYTWLTSVEMPGAAGDFSSVVGKTDATAGTILDSGSGSKAVQLVRKNGTQVIKTARGWLTAVELSAMPGGEGMAGLANTKTPADELALLLPKLDEFKTTTGGSFIAAMKSPAARDFLENSQANGSRFNPGGQMPAGPHDFPGNNLGNAPVRPAISEAKVDFQIWLTHGLPQKYVLTISASVTTMGMRKDIRKVEKVQLGAFNTTKVVLPVAAEAKMRLGAGPKRQAGPLDP